MTPDNSSLWKVWPHGDKWYICLPDSTIVAQAETETIAESIVQLAKERDHWKQRAEAAEAKVQELHERLCRTVNCIN